MRWLVTRPEPDGKSLMQRLGQMGHSCVFSPMLCVVPRAVEPPDWSAVAAIVFTSRNGVRHGGAPYPPQALRLPVFAVGDATARAARGAGFPNVTSAGGGIEDLAVCLKTNLTETIKPVMHITGESSAGDLAATAAPWGVTVNKMIAYAMQPAVALTPQALAGFRACALHGAILLSPQTAQVFARLARQAGVVPLADDFVFAVISPATAEPLATLGGQVRAAARPDLNSVLALLG